MPEVKHGKRKYKQMALEVAVRNPERYYDFLKTFSKFEGLCLNDSTILNIYAQLFLDGVISTDKIDIESTTTNELKNFIRNNLTHNNEWGFPTGYQAAFTRYLKTLSEFGFIYSQYNKIFQLSEVAKALMTDKITLSEAFALQSMRFFRKSPYRRVLNDFNYFDFILKVIRKRNEDGHKLSYPQFMLSLFSIDGNVNSFCLLINHKKIGNDFDKAYAVAKSLYENGDEKFDKVCKQQSAFNDYGNTVFRVLQLTGFITVENNGLLMLSFNNNRLDFYKDLINQNFTVSENAKENNELYFKELGSFSDELFDSINRHRGVQQESVNGYNEKLEKIINDFKLDKDSIAKQLEKLSIGSKEKGKFWFIQEPLQFEFLLSLYLYACLGNDYDYKPNYKCDTAGIPYSHAPGNIGDIEISNSNRYWLIEATLIRNKQQQINSETMNLFRHVNDNYEGAKYMSLVAPVIHQDTALMLKVATVVTMEEKKSLLYSKPYSTSEFIEKLRKGDCIQDMQNSTMDFMQNLGNFLNNAINN